MSAIDGSAALLEINRRNYKKFASSFKVNSLGLQKIIYDENIYLKLGKEFIDNVIEEARRDGYIKHDLLVKIVRRAFGNHTVHILKDRPHLDVFNIENFKVFDKKIYDVMGENFVQQLLNFNYSLLFENRALEYDKFLTNLITSSEKLSAFKYCLEYITTEQKTVYSYTKAILLFSEYEDLFFRMFNNQDKLTCNDHKIIRSIIARPQNILNVTSIKNLPRYESRIKTYFDKKLEDKLLFGDRFDVADIIFERFFGLVGGKKMFYSRSITSVNTLTLTYNIDRLIALEENAEKFNRSRMLHDEELSVLKLISAIDKMVKICNGKTGVDTLKSLYYTLDKAVGEQNAKNPIIGVADCKYLFDKIPLLYYEDLKKNLTNIDMLEDAVQNNEKGIEKTFISTKTKSGRKIEVPVYHLKGIEYIALVSTTSCKLNQIFCEFFDGVVSSVAEDWFEIENGISTISCSTTSLIADSSIETNRSSRVPETAVTFMFGKNVDIVVMGDEDVFTSSEIKNPDTTADMSYAGMFMCDDLDYKSTRSLYNEVVIERYSAEQNKKGGKIIPEAIFKTGTTVDKEILKHAVKMTEYLIENGLREKGYVFPIVMLDKCAYVGLKMGYERHKEKEHFSTQIDSLSRNEYNPFTQVQMGMNYINDVIDSLNGNSEIID